MATPIILFNNSTGSDTQSSGAGPSTAEYGTSASYSGSVFTLDGSPDLSGVATDSSHVIWVSTSTGRKFFTINAADDGADTVTVDVAPAGSSSGLTWGLGGKRETLAGSSELYAQGGDVKPGWILEFETDQTFSTTTQVGAFINLDEKSVTWRSADNTIKTFTTTTDGTSTVSRSCIHIYGTHNYRFENLKFENSAATTAYAIGVSLGVHPAGTCSGVVFKNCIFGDATNTLNFGVWLYDGGIHTPNWRFINCEIAHCVDDGVVLAGGNYGTTYFHGCSIHDNGDNGIVLDRYFGSEIRDTIIYNNGGHGVFIAGKTVAFANVTINRCTIHGNTGDGIRVHSLLASIWKGHMVARLAVINNNITGNGGYGIDDHTEAPTDSASGPAAFVDYNNFGTGSTANTSGTISEGVMEPNSLTVDPGYTDVAAADFSVDVSVKGLGFPNGTQTLGAGQSGTSSYIDIGAAQRQEAGGGGGSSRLINGGLIS